MLDLTTSFATFPVLTTPRCTLRALTLADTDALFRILSSPDVNRYMGHPPMQTQAEAAARIQMYHNSFQKQTGLMWGVFNRETDALMGTCVLWNFVRQHYRAEIGYLLHPDWWRQGIMTEVATAAIDFIFAEIQLHSLEAHIDPENAASRRLLEKLGFVQEGYFRENYYDTAKSEFVDTAVFSLLKPHWTQR